MVSNSRDGSKKTKEEKVQISCRRRIWKKNHKMHKMQTAWTYGKTHAMNTYMILMPHHLLLQSQRKSEARKVSL